MPHDEVLPDTTHHPLNDGHEARRLIEAGIDVATLLDRSKHGGP
jgi:hypothetical protein